jgi:hypothetical protein
MEVNMKLLAFAAFLPLLCFAAEPDVVAAAPVAALSVDASPDLSPQIAAASKAAFQNSGATPGQTGATPAPARKTKKRSETKTFLWVMGGIAAAALAIGLTAAAQGKSPF